MNITYPFKTTGTLKADTLLRCTQVAKLGVFATDAEISLYDGEDNTGLLVYTNLQETSPTQGLIDLNVEVGGKLWAEITTAETASYSGVVLYIR